MMSGTKLGYGLGADIVSHEDRKEGVQRRRDVADGDVVKGEMLDYGSFS